MKTLLILLALGIIPLKPADMDYTTDIFETSGGDLAIGFIGHVDTAWLHGFADPDNPMDPWNKRITPFREGVNVLLAKRQPTGMALAYMNKMYILHNNLITNTYDRIQKHPEVIDNDFYTRLGTMFITRSDAQNYMIFGDPAVHLRISAS